MEPKFTAVQIAKPESINFILGQTKRRKFQIIERTVAFHHGKAPESMPRFLPVMCERQKKAII